MMVDANENTTFFTSVRASVKLFTTVILIALSGMISAVSAATWYVSMDGSDSHGGTSWADALATIQKGIDTASNGDTVWVADGTYTGEDNKNIELQAKAIVVKSLRGPENCVIDCENYGRGFYIHEGEGRNTVISGFTIKNGNAGANYYGGAIYCQNLSNTASSTPTIDNCIIKNNTADNGGGIACLRTGVTVTNCQIINNRSTNGGGIFSLWPRLERDSLFLVNSIISGNHASNEGGGVWFYKLPFAGAHLEVTNATIVNNVAPDGGGVYLEACTQEMITNSVMWGNSASNMAVYNCSPIVTHSAGTGYTGEGNIEEDPLFVSTTDPDPENWNLRLKPGSNCIDTGSNSVVGIPEKDIDGKPRFIDGDGDEYMTAQVDMGAYEYGDICECDYFKDLDTDGEDLTGYLNDPERVALSILAEDFGRDNCPNYEFTPY